MPVISLFGRTNPSPVGAAQSNDSVAGMYIVGFSIAGAILLGIALWVGIHFYRKRLAKKRQDKTGASFLSVRGLVKEDDSSDEKGIPSSCVDSLLIIICSILSDPFPYQPKQPFPALFLQK